jgi:hypothetical protein
MPISKLTLSGGGFRATVYHLGVVRYLCEAGILARITHIASVSGGSILAGHLALRWTDYNATDPQTFGRAANELLSFVGRDIRGSIFRTWSFVRLFPTLIAPILAALLAPVFPGAFLWIWLSALAAGWPELSLRNPGRPRGQFRDLKFMRANPRTARRMAERCS